jgi:hypothetical protein
MNMKWPRNVIVQDDNIVVGVLLADSELQMNSYISVAGGLDDDDVKQILQEWREGSASGQLREFRWREEPNR